MQCMALSIGVRCEHMSHSRLYKVQWSGRNICGQTVLYRVLSRETLHDFFSPVLECYSRDLGLHRNEMVYIFYA